MDIITDFGSVVPGSSPGGCTDITKTASWRSLLYLCTQASALRHLRPGLERRSYVACDKRVGAAGSYERMRIRNLRRVLVGANKPSLQRPYYTRIVLT